MAIAPTVVTQGEIIINQAGEGLQVMLDWLSGPPLNLQSEQVTEYVDQASAWLQEQSGQIAGGVISGAMTVGSILVTIVMTLVFTFFILKDGERFGPWVRKFSGPTAGMHLTEAFARIWKTVGGFFKAQAAVSFVDAVFIGLGLVILGVPMAFVLAIITFFGGFIPIVGAFTAGALAVLVALVSEGFTIAVWVLVIVLAVQQLEGNVLQPLLLGKAARGFHPNAISEETKGSSSHRSHAGPRPAPSGDRGVVRKTPPVVRPAFAKPTGRSSYVSPTLQRLARLVCVPSDFAKVC